MSGKILVVDDESIVLDSCQRVLEEGGFEVCLVASADKALDRLKRQDFGLLLLDIKMPGRGGIRLMEEVKNHWPAIPVIAMSGYHTADTIAEAYAKGAVTFIAKPFEPEELLDAVRQVIARIEKPRRRRILVIDDEQVVLDSVGQILTAEDYAVDTCASGTEGRDRVMESSYDLVLTDIRMPDIDGITLLRHIKRARPSLPVIIITGYGATDSAVQAMKLGAADYIEKPFEPEDLLAAVASALGISLKDEE